MGLGTCFYRGRGRFGLPTLFESLCITTDFVPMAFIANWIGIRAAYGATIAIRRDALDAAGGFDVAAEQLADDYVLAQRVAGAGYELAVLPYVVDTVLEVETVGEVWRHQMRWARTYRACQAGGWFMASLVQMTTWACAFWLATGGAASARDLLVAALGLRLSVLGVIVYLLRDREAALSLWLLPLKDLVMSAIWVVSWLGREVEWSGQRFRVEASGRMTRLPARSCPAPSLAAPSP